MSGTTVTTTTIVIAATQKSSFSLQAVVCIMLFINPISYFQSVSLLSNKNNSDSNLRLLPLREFGLGDQSHRETQYVGKLSARCGENKLF